MKPPKKGPSPKDIAAALETEKNCLYLMSRETVQELANLKEEERRYERLVELYQNQIDALESKMQQPAPTSD
ncbi:hypothetical protein ABBQ38_011913 [Trebouxia sp. C0009 RCD-2024]